MAEKHEIRLRLALFGPAGSGKTAALECLHRSMPADSRGPLIQITSSAGRTLLYDHAEFQLGQVGPLPLYVDVYALPGNPGAVLARRMVVSGCDGFIYVADGRDTALLQARAGFQELTDILAERGRALPDAAVVVALTRQDLADQGGGLEQTAAALRPQVGNDRLLLTSTKTGHGLLEAVRKATALTLALERDALEARRRGDPPPRVHVPPDLAEEVDQAYRIYGKASAQAGESFSPHGDLFFGRILLELGALSQEDLEEGMRLFAEANRLSLRVSLEDILSKRELLDRERLPRAQRLRCAVEAIHEEVLYGRLACSVGAVPLPRVKQAMSLQIKRHFHYCLDHLLTRAGHLDRLGRRQVLIKLLQTHQGEMLRDEREQSRSVTPIETAPLKSGTPSTGRWDAVPLFGQVALNLGLVTNEQVDECLREQRQLRQQGKHRFLGAIMRARGYLGEEEIQRVCEALEEKLSDDSIPGYRILQRLGRGNMALVYAAIQQNLDRVVALKLLDPKLLFDSDFIERFLSEAKAAARLNHPNIVQAYDVGSRDDLHYFAMEFVDGVTIRELMDEQQGRMDELTSLDVIVQVARALDHASQHHLVHRDVKPGNVMITREGVVKLCDLGLAKTLDSDGPGEEAVVLGSPYYISPEQIEGRSDLDTRADIYSLGAMFFHMVTGRPPFLGRTPEEVCLKHLSEPVPDPAQLSATATTRITPIIFRMMAKDRTHRFATCADVVRSLLEVQPDAGSDHRQRELSLRVRGMVPTRRFLKRR